MNNGFQVTGHQAKKDTISEWQETNEASSFIAPVPVVRGFLACGAGMGSMGCPGNSADSLSWGDGTESPGRWRQLKFTRQSSRKEITEQSQNPGDLQTVCLDHCMLGCWAIHALRKPWGWGKRHPRRREVIVLSTPTGPEWKNIIRRILDFPGGAVVKNPPANAGDTGSSPGPGRSHMLQSN